MLQRFAAGSAISSMGIAVAALVVLLTPDPKRSYALTILWCLIPTVWGLWAMLAPKAWIPQRFPLWGAILGLALGLLAMFVLNLPTLVFGGAFPAWRRGLAVLLVVAFYYLLWMLVRVVYRRLAGLPSSG